MPANSHIAQRDEIQHHSTTCRQNYEYIAYHPLPTDFLFACDTLSFCTRATGQRTSKASATKCSPYPFEGNGKIFARIPAFSQNCSRAINSSSKRGYCQTSVNVSKWGSDLSGFGDKASRFARRHSKDLRQPSSFPHIAGGSWRTTSSCFKASHSL